MKKAREADVRRVLKIQLVTKGRLLKFIYERGVLHVIESIYVVVAIGFFIVGL